MTARCTTFALLLSLTVGANAQTLTTSNAMPAVGDQFTYHMGTYLPPGSEGEGQTWDLSGLISDQTFTSEYISPAATGHDVAFPWATMAAHSAGQPTGFAFYAGMDAGVYFQGTANPNSTIPYTNTELILPIPCSYSTFWMDDFQSNAQVGGVPMMRNGMVNGSADGYGTLILPFGSIANVLRTHMTEVYTDDVQTMFPMHIEYNNDVYSYYKPGVHHAIAVLATLTTTTNGLPSTVQTALWTADETVGVQDALRNAIGIDVFPNPAQYRLTLTYGSQGGNMQVEVLDANGREVLNTSIQAALGIGNQTLDVGALPQGLYLVRVTDRRGQQGTCRFVKR